MFMHGSWCHVVHLVPTIEILLTDSVIALDILQTLPWELVPVPMETLGRTALSSKGWCDAVFLSLTIDTDWLSLKSCMCWLKKMVVSALSPKEMVLSVYWVGAIALFLNCIRSEGLGTSLWNFMEGVCDMMVSPNSCCQAIGILTSGPQCLTVSKQLSNLQWYCGETHPVCRLSTRCTLLRCKGCGPKLTPRCAHGDLWGIEFLPIRLFSNANPGQPKAW